MSKLRQFQGPYSVDLLTSTPVKIGSVVVSVSNVKRLKYKLLKNVTLSSSAPAEFQSSSILISGSVSGHSFVFTTSTEIEMSVAGPNSVNLQNNDQLLLQFNLSNLLKRIDFTPILSTSSTVNINENNKIQGSSALCSVLDSSVTDLYTCFLLALKVEVNFGKDSDGSGELDHQDGTVK